MEKGQFSIENDIPVFIIFGQSNAHGHGTRLIPELEINKPLNNVMGLNREYNQFYGIQRLTWSGYTSWGMNLGETQDHTYCLASEFARMWQADIDMKKRKLPDLYIVQISIGAQGIARQEKWNANMWYPQRKKIMVPGNLTNVNISLYPLALEILKCMMKAFNYQKKRVKILGLHWNQWEAEVMSGKVALQDAKQNYKEIFEGFSYVLGYNFPIYLYRPLSDRYQNPDGVTHITNIFKEFVSMNMPYVPEYKMIDISQSDLWNPESKTKGIFQEDAVHYTEKAQQWFAKYQYNEIFG